MIASVVSHVLRAEYLKMASNVSSWGNKFLFEASEETQKCHCVIVWRL